MRRFGPVFAVSVMLTAVAAAMWGAATDWTVTHAEPTATALDRPAAIAVSVIAALCWSAWARGRGADRERMLLIRTLSRTVPMRRVQ